MICFIDQRDRDFMAVCRRLIARQEGPHVDYKRIAEQAAMTRPPRYYISSIDHALSMVKKLRGGEMRRGRNCGLWADLSERAERRERERGVSCGIAIQQEIAQGAPSTFHLSPNAAYRLLLKSLPRRRKRRPRSPKN